ncbi:MAG TPA: extensin family protein [Stellaceae bacterium]|nr:extensin family protein [Stellaceae bacterium]
MTGADRLARSAAAAGLILLAACARGAASPDAAQCFADLDRLGLLYTPIPAPSGPAACAVRDPIEVRVAGIAWTPPGVVNRGFARKLDAFTRQDVQAAALAHLGQRVRFLHQIGAYSCRRETGGKHRWSEHASGNALDIASFELANGTIINVEHDWRRSGPKRDFLRDVARRGCKRFSVVLTPSTNREHRDHIHVDAGPYKLCSM